MVSALSLDSIQPALQREFSTVHPRFLLTIRRTCTQTYLSLGGIKTTRFPLLSHTPVAVSFAPVVDRMGRPVRHFELGLNEQMTTDLRSAR